MAGLPEYKIDRFGNVWGELNKATGAAHIPCVIKWGDDDRNVFLCEDKDDLRTIILAVAKEKDHRFNPEDVIKLMTQPVLTQLEVTSGLRQSSIDERWNVW